MPVTEWKLFDGDAPEFSTLVFFRDHPWVPPDRQDGHAERTAMAASVVAEAVTQHHPLTLSDLGCGDGSLLARLRGLPVRAWGYDAGTENVAKAREQALDVRQGDILSPGIEYGELITCCEVLEHLTDPHGFLKSLPGGLLVITSPSAENADQHYEHHAWAWDLDGYRELAEQAGWSVEAQAECDALGTSHGGQYRPQRFQAIFARRVRS
jgi:trans-aconitate methyltransferase